MTTNNNDLPTNTLLISYLGICLPGIRVSIVLYTIAENISFFEQPISSFYNTFPVLNNQFPFSNIQLFFNQLIILIPVQLAHF